MRVISGSARGTRLLAPKTGTRPTSDRAKESIFNIIAEKIPDSSFLDLFAGSGAIGIEALSRRARHAVFIDNSKEAIEIINKNLSKTKLSDRAAIFDDISKIGHTSTPDIFDIIFMDPPFDKNLIEPTLDIIINKKLLAPKGLIIAELPKQTGEHCSPLQYLPVFLQIIHVRTYGRSSFVFLEEI